MNSKLWRARFAFLLHTGDFWAFAKNLFEWYVPCNDDSIKMRYKCILKDFFNLRKFANTIAKGLRWEIGTAIEINSFRNCSASSNNAYIEIHVGNHQVM